MATQSPIIDEGTIVTIKKNEVIVGERFRSDGTDKSESSVTFDGKMKAKVMKVSGRTSMSNSADNTITFRITMDHPKDTYTVERLDSDIKPVLVSQVILSPTSGGLPFLQSLIPDETDWYLLAPVKFPRGFSDIVIPAGTKIKIVSPARTKKGGKPGTISPKNAFYDFQVYVETTYRYRWKSAYIGTDRLDMSA